MRDDPCQYFIVYGAIQGCKSVEDWLSFQYAFLHTLKEAGITATLSMNSAPMLAVLFIGARMRALQIDPVSGAPKKWAQHCFFMGTYALMAQTCLCVAIPVVLGGKAKKGRVEGDMEYEVNNMVQGIIMTIIRFAITICIYVGFTCVIWSIFTTEHPAGPQYTPPISVTMLVMSVIPIFAGKVIRVAAKTGDINNDAKPFEQPIIAGCFTDLKFLIMFGKLAATLSSGTASAPSAAPCRPPVL